jgi:hypothetical protein
VSDARDLTRREAIEATVGAIVASHLGTLRAAAADPQLRFFTASEFALAEILAELIVPADAHSPGARAAGVALHIDGYLAEAFTDEPRQLWREGLKHIDTLSTVQHGRQFAELATPVQTQLLERLASNEQKPTTRAEQFFVEVKRQTIRAYYTSKTGIHDDLNYKGNVLLQEFVGTDVSPKPPSQPR